MRLLGICHRKDSLVQYRTMLDFLLFDSESARSDDSLVTDKTIWHTILVRTHLYSSDIPNTLPILQIYAPILLVIISLPISTALVLWCLSTLPISVSWPHNITDLAQLGRELHGYSQSGPGPLAHVIGVMAISAIWKHAWSIPGSVLWVRFSFC